MTTIGLLSVSVLLVFFLQGFVKWIHAPLRYAGNIFCWMVLALGALCLINLLGAQWGVFLPVNWFSVGMIALFRLPGLLAVATLHFLLI